MRGSEGFQQEALGGCSISSWAEQELERIALRINRSIQIDPHFLTLIYVSSTRQESVVDFRMGTATAFKLWRIVALPNDRSWYDQRRDLAPASFLPGRGSLKRSAAYQRTRHPNEVGLEMTPRGRGSVRSWWILFVLLFPNCIRSASFLQHYPLCYQYNRSVIISLPFTWIAYSSEKLASGIYASIYLQKNVIHSLQERQR